jgi:hypothetical protein
MSHPKAIFLIVIFLEEVFKHVVACGGSLDAFFGHDVPDSNPHKARYNHGTA